MYVHTSIHKLYIISSDSGPTIEHHVDVHLSDLVRKEEKSNGDSPEMASSIADHTAQPPSRDSEDVKRIGTG